MLRPYQFDAVKAAYDWIRTSTEPCFIDAPTGAGKSHIIAHLADYISQSSGGRKVLILAPNKELVTQNREKVRNLGIHSTIACASAGQVSFRGSVVVGSPDTVVNRLGTMGANWGSIIVDEAHGVTPTLKKIINTLRAREPKIRLVGLSATPYRLGEGYVYEIGPDNKLANEDEGPRFFKKCVYRIEVRDLIRQGFLCPPVVGVSEDSYDTKTLLRSIRGYYSNEDLKRIFNGKQRLTSQIMMDVVNKSIGRGGTLIFASTVQHAYECLEALPAAESSVIHGETPKPERENIVEKFRDGRIKYLVNVSVLTTGFDAPICDVVAVLRPTESPGLLQQMYGRGYRLYEGKKDCLILDYAGNIERHFPDGDVTNPEISSHRSGESSYADFECPRCRGMNSFSLAPNPDKLTMDRFGYYIDLAGNYMHTTIKDMNGEDVLIPIAGHTGRRCVNYSPEGIRCGHRWDYKLCPHCNAENDIASVVCVGCDGELVDPNSKLQMSYEAYIKDPYSVKCEEVLDMKWYHHISMAGNKCIAVEYTTTNEEFVTFLQPHAPQFWLKSFYLDWKSATKNGSVRPKTITFKLTKKGFYEVIAYNKPVTNESNYLDASKN